MRSDSQRAATRRYNDKTYDSIQFRGKKGLRDEYKRAAAERGISLSALIQAAVREYIANHPV